MPGSQKVRGSNPLGSTSSQLEIDGVGRISRTAVGVLRGRPGRLDASAPWAYAWADFGSRPDSVGRGSEEGAMRNKFLIAAVVAAFAALGPISASADTGHTVTSTQNVHGSWVETGDFNPCTGDAISVAFTGNMVMHVTFFPAGDEVWATFTEAGSITFVDNSVTYSGHATAWGNFNVNEKNANSEFTLTVHAQGSDGSVIMAHLTFVFVLNANGQVTVNFAKMVLTCG